MAVVLFNIRVWVSSTPGLIFALLTISLASRMRIFDVNLASIRQNKTSVQVSF